MADSGSSESEYDLVTPPPGADSLNRLPVDDEERPAERPRRPQPQTPLPRLSRTLPPSTDDEGRPSPPSPRAEAGGGRASRASRNAERRSRRGGPADEAEADEEGRTLIAPTPTLDTVETRGRVRLVLGAMAVGSVVLAIAMVVRAVGGGRDDTEGVYVLDSTQMFGPTAVANRPVSADAPADPEKPARDLYNRARAALTINLARSQLQRIVDSYPDSQAAADSRDALDRITRGLAPFPDIPSLAPEGFTRAPEPAPEPAPPAAVVAAPVPEPEPEPELVVRILPSGFSPVPDSGEDSSGWPNRIVDDRDGMTMILVPAGVYPIGRDGGPPSEGPAHRVELPPYYMDEHEVSVAQFARYRQAMIQRGESVQPAPEDLTRLGFTDRHPVVLVSAREAIRYAEWAGKTLPTEAQWEAAARGPEGLIHPWGAGPPPWPARRSNRQIEPIQSYPDDRSAEGVFDLAANAWEWTTDWFDSGSYAARARLVARNPGGPDRPSTQPPRQTVRGASPNHETTYRVGMPVETRLPYLGFRCVLNVEGLPVFGLPEPSPPAFGTPGSTPPQPQQHPQQPPPQTPPRQPAQQPAPRPPAGSGTLVPF